MIDTPRPRFRRLALACWLGYWALLFTATHIPQPELPDLPQHSDLLVHFGGYATLVLLCAWAVIRGAPHPTRRLIAWSMVFVIYGALDEWLQQFVNRTPTLIDFLADAAGVVAGAALAGIVMRRPRAR